jgi:hypothetical protein
MKEIRFIDFMVYEKDSVEKREFNLYTPQIFQRKLITVNQQ